MSSTDTIRQAEQKYEDEGGRTLRFSKDDRKEQMASTRTGTKPVLTEQIISDRPPFATNAQQHSRVTGFERDVPNRGGQDAIAQKVISSSSRGQNANAALAPIVQPSQLVAEKQELKHIQQGKPTEFGSIHMNSSSSTTLSGDPIQPTLDFEEIGEQAAAGWETIKARAEPQIQKAKELFHLGKSAESGTIEPKDSSAIGGSSGEPSTIDQAKEAFVNMQDSVKQMYDQNVKPTIDTAREKVTETYQAYQRKGTQPAQQKEFTAPRVSRTYTTQPRMKEETMSHRLRRYRNKAVSIWEGNEPMVKERLQSGISWVKANKLEIPLLVLSTLLVLWMSASFISWLAMPRINPANEQVVLFEPQQQSVPVVEPFKPMFPEPTQDVSGPSVLDQVKLKAGELGDRLSDELGTLKMKGTDRLEHVKDAVKGAIPSIPSTLSMPSMPSMEDVKSQASEGLSKVKEGVQDLKNRAAQTVGSSSERFEADDPNAPPHWHTAPTPTSQLPLEQQHVEQNTVPAHEPGTPPHMHTIPTQA